MVYSASLFPVILLVLMLYMFIICKHSTVSGSWIVSFAWIWVCMFVVGLIWFGYLIGLIWRWWKEPQWNRDWNGCCLWSKNLLGCHTLRKPWKASIALQEFVFWSIKVNFRRNLRMSLFDILCSVCLCLSRRLFARDCGSYDQPWHWWGETGTDFQGKW